MAQFYASIQGNRGEATRMGTKSSGIYGHIRGWDIGAEINMMYDEKTDSDICQITVTGGSNAPGKIVQMFEFRIQDGTIYKHF